MFMREPVPLPRSRKRERGDNHTPLPLVASKQVGKGNLSHSHLWERAGWGELANPNTPNDRRMLGFAFHSPKPAGYWITAFAGMTSRQRECAKICALKPNQL